MRQISRFHRRLAAGAFLIVAGPVALGSVAYACQSLATLHANPSSVAAGEKVIVNGKNYSSSDESSPVEIRLDDRQGRILRTFPAGVREINGEVSMEGVDPGPHTLIATQTTSSGNAVSGTPGRATIMVTAPRSANQAGTAPAAATADAVAAAPVAATPAAPAAQAGAPAPAAKAAAGAASLSEAAPAAPAAAGAAAAPGATDVAAPAAAGAAATGVAASGGPAAVADPSAPAAQSAAQVDTGLLAAASSESSSALASVALAAALALVLLGLGAFVKSGRSTLAG